MESENFSSPYGSLPDRSGPNVQTPSPSNIATKTPMSANLRERLRKTRRSFNSPFIMPKRLKIDCQTEGGGNTNPDTDVNSHSPGEACCVHAGANTGTENLCSKLVEGQPEMSTMGECQRFHCTAAQSIHTPATSSSSNCLPPTTEQRQLLEKERLQSKVREKEEVLRRLKMVQMYRAKFLKDWYHVLPRPSGFLSFLTAHPVLQFPLRLMLQALCSNVHQYLDSLSCPLFGCPETRSKTLQAPVDGISNQLANNLAELGSLIEKWRKSSQSLLYELQVALSTDIKPTLTQLIDSLAVEDKLLHYNRLEEDFTDA